MDMRKLNDFFTQYKEWIKKSDSTIQNKEKKVRIAILTSFTLKGMEKILYVLCRESGVFADIYMAGYNQVNQEILNPDSELYEFQPDIVFLFVDSQTLYGEEWFYFNSMKPADQNKKIESVTDYLAQLTENLKITQKTKIILHNLEVPHYSSLGILDNKQDTGFIEGVKQVNTNLVEIFKEDTARFLFDYDQFCSRIGKDHIQDEKMYYIGDFKLDMKWMGELGHEWMGYVKAILGLTKKCIVLDLDNTLWGGVIGEDGIEGLKLGPDTEGKPFLEFQKYLLALYQRGVILAINSKNNFDDAIEVLQKHPYMILREEHFAAMQINWNDKASNIRHLASQLNIGTDSFVFFDDDPLNREMVRSELPEVHVPELPKDPSLYSTTLRKMNDFNMLFLSGEDRDKGKMYAQQRQRSNLEKSFTDVVAYLKALDMTVTVELANKFTIPRITQLIQKTNQFNLTTKRYQIEEVKKFAEDDSWLIASVAVRDKFGDNGITGCVIVEKKEQEWFIDTFLLSCRIIGREVEKVLLKYIMDKAHANNVSLLKGHYILSEKNQPARELYKSNGFTMVQESDIESFWIKKVTEGISVPQIFEVVIK